MDFFLSTDDQSWMKHAVKTAIGAAISMEYKTDTSTIFERKCLELMFSCTKMEKRNVGNNKTERER